METNLTRLVADLVLRSFAVRDEINFEFVWQVSYIKFCLPVHGILTDQASTLEVREVEPMLCVMLVFLTVVLAAFQRQDFQLSLYMKFAHVQAVDCHKGRATLCRLYLSNCFCFSMICQIQNA